MRGIQSLSHEGHTQEADREAPEVDLRGLVEKGTRWAPLAQQPETGDGTTVAHESQCMVKTSVTRVDGLAL